MSTGERYPARPTQQISGPAELVQAVPYLLHFHPQRSLVLVGLQDRQLVVTARVDLRDADIWLRHTLAAMARAGTTSVVAVIYDDEESQLDTEPSWSGLIPMLDYTAEECGCDLVDVLLVRGQRWRSLQCQADCCPPEGRELPEAPSPFTVAAAYDGVVALPDREARAALLDAVPAPDPEALDAALEAAEHAAVRATLDGHARRWERSAKRALFAAARESDEVGWEAAAEPDIARFGVALGVTAIRDALWVAIDNRRLDGRPLWRDLARRLPSPYDVCPLFLFGWASWRAGDGTMAGMAAERAVLSDPEYTAADLLLAAVAQGVDPRQIRRLRLPRSA